jgi:hypothetical protein
MKKLIALVALMGISALISESLVFAHDDLEPYLGVKDVRIGGQWFLSYLTGRVDGGPAVNEFVIRRGYINIYKDLTSHLSGRITPDVSVDHEGDGLGDVELRLKYVHLITKLNDLAFFTKPYFEFGLVHRPWLDFEQSINTYRVQGTMFIERVKVLNSADFGLTFFSLLGGELDEDYQKNVNKAYPGKYGSIAIGVYNGGGYHAIEENKNKTIESRVSLRPLPGILPGLQVSYYGGYGKGNTTYEPKWTLNGAMVSYEAPRFILTGQAYAGVGNSYGHYVDENKVAKSHNGYSFFGECKMLSKQLSLIARYDYWNGENSETIEDRLITGIAYRFAQKSKVVLDYDMFRNRANGDDFHGVFETAFEVKF